MVVGSGPRDATLNLVAIRAGGLGAVPGLMGTINLTLLLAAQNSAGFIVSVIWPIPVVCDGIVIAFASITC